MWMSKGDSTQYCLLNLLEKWKNPGDKGKSFGALLTDLKKSISFSRTLLVTANLNAYGFNLPVLRLIHVCLSNKKQRLMIIIILDQKHCLAFPKGQFLVHFF